MAVWGCREALQYDGKGPESSQVVVSGTLDGEKVEGTIALWTGTLIPEENTQVLLSFANGALKGLPFLTARKYGKGYALYYVADEVDTALLEKIIRHTALLAGLSLPSIPGGVDCITRGEYVFISNFNSTVQEFDSPWKGKNILGNALQDGKLRIGPLENAILEIKKEK